MGKKNDSNTRARQSSPDGDVRTGVDIPDADREVLGQPIDKRMKALEDDLIAMGARPGRAEQRKLDEAGR